jgi:hypothetical protein
MKLPIVLMKSGASYEGEWKNGKRDGFGKYTWPDKSYYVGHWKNDRAAGKGKMSIAEEYDKLSQFISMETSTMESGMTIKPTVMERTNMLEAFSTKGNGEMISKMGVGERLGKTVLSILGSISKGRSMERE